MPVFPSQYWGGSPDTIGAVRVYCTTGDIARRMSLMGRDLRLDDNDDSMVDADEELAVDDCILDASETINMYLYSKYTPANLAQSAWVNRRCVDVAVYVLCSRRMNDVPESAESRYETAIEELKAIADGPRTVPGIPLRFSLAPRYSNVRVDDRYRFKKIRVESQISSKPPQGYVQNVDWAGEWCFEI